MKVIKFNPTKLLMFALIPLFLSSGCNDLFDDGRTTYSGPAVLEFKPLSQTFTLAADEAGATSVDVQLIGEQRDQDLSISFVVVDSLTTSEVEFYSLPTTSVTILADSSSASFNINITGENLEAGDTAQLVLELQGNDEQNVQPAENLKRYTLTLQGGG